MYFRQKKRLIALFILTVIFLVLFLTPAGAAETKFELEAEAAILIDALAGNILYEKNIHEPLPPASITKIMTLLLALEAIEEGKVRLGEEVVVSERAASMGGSQIFLSPGDVVTMEELLIGIAVGSGNDASVAVAEHIAGSLEGFVDMMNERASQLVMDHTVFQNACGLHIEGHVTTAYDIALMSRELLKYPEIHEWFTIWLDEDFLEGRISVEEGIYLSNTNRMVRYYPGCDGLKTGYTSQAGHCIAATAKRDDTRFIAVILNAPDSKTRFNEAGELLDYAFANFETVLLAEKGQVIEEVQVEKGKESTVELILPEELGILVEKAEAPDFEKEVVITHSLTAPLTVGEKLGELIISREGQEVLKKNLVAEKSIDRASLLDIFHRILSEWVKFGR